MRRRRRPAAWGAAARPRVLGAAALRRPTPGGRAGSYLRRRKIRGSTRWRRPVRLVPLGPESAVSAPPTAICTLLHVNARFFLTVRRYTHTVGRTDPKSVV